ncbi:hypothetical protein BU24DRAFT_19201 [Aaosphaeria arxii CBS 175.79]|uniref:Uncharacterized protein n=1 Tax=Aaosphaeria arxii CBS 175.79 TaxID=1450172 RepID=A0A6A5Y712_9PLEO|nr:uncharacterized protein BU24DRAFT_19201 [Aaosphaeria arxii CBS 175.79]KAF2021318.1 hypothetical protein BU24DRAFT_19201 [Aaosphaeria arxii CBS 175.79]
MLITGPCRYLPSPPKLLAHSIIHTIHHSSHAFITTTRASSPLMSPSIRTCNDNKQLSPLLRTRVTLPYVAMPLPRSLLTPSSPSSPTPITSISPPPLGLRVLNPPCHRDRL